MNIYISNIGSKVTDDSLAAVFSTFGVVHSFTITSDGPASDNNRIAMVTMSDEKEAMDAIEKLHGKFIDGCVISVKALGNNQ